MIAIKGAEIPRCCQNCFLIRYHDTLGYSCKATKNHIAKADVALKRADDCPLVEIVTCKDCKYYCIDEDGCGYHCEKSDTERIPTCADFYCIHAERRE